MDEHLQEEEADFYDCLSDDGTMLRYNNTWMTVEDGIDLWINNAKENYALALRELLERVTAETQENYPKFEDEEGE